MQVADGQIVLEFAGGEGQPFEYLSYSAQSGEVLRAYSREAGAPGVFACFDGRNDFTFLTNTNRGFRALVHAIAR